MDKFETDLEIDQPPSRVFEFLVDQENKPLWISDFFKTEQIQGEQGEAGSIARQIFFNNGRKVAFLEEITEAHEGEVIEGVMHAEHADVHFRNEMQPKAQGQKTFLKVAVEYFPKSFMGKLRSFLRPNWLRKKYEKDLSNLKSAVEQMRDS